MAGVYFHIPFCRQACHYCNFHFSTSLAQKDALIQTLVAELGQRSGEIREPIETIYFGGGTPSLLTVEELSGLLEAVTKVLPVGREPEVTLEANPDDLDEDKIRGLRSAGVNRLSLGVQSFLDDDLRYMNRVHTVDDAKRALDLSLRTIGNVSLDLIFGTPTLDNRAWKENVQIAVNSGVPHISAYALTVEDKTALAHFIKTGKALAPDEQRVAEQFEIAMDLLAEAGYDHYEISNYCKPGFESRHNRSYWTRTPYLGIGPSAHSFNGAVRRWNVANNAAYIQQVPAGSAEAGHETLSDADRTNEHIMTGLRTKWGCDVQELRALATPDQMDELMGQLAILAADNMLRVDDQTIHLTRTGKLLADGIISRLFVT